MSSTKSNHAISATGVLRLTVHHFPPIFHTIDAFRIFDSLYHSEFRRFYDRHESEGAFITVTVEKVNVSSLYCSRQKSYARSDEVRALFHWVRMLGVSRSRLTYEL